jgi:hypothetical protein
MTRIITDILIRAIYRLNGRCLVPRIVNAGDRRRQFVDKRISRLYNFSNESKQKLRRGQVHAGTTAQRTGIAENPSVDQRRMDLRAAGRKDTRVVYAGCHRYHGRGHPQQCPSRVRLAYNNRRTTDGFFNSRTSLSGVVPRANERSSPSEMSVFFN